ncbi:IS5 family transposase [Salipiger sp. IMCC34102]|nr:IS5 family transposase [Salipiger sp. IMCC34102]
MGWPVSRHLKRRSSRTIWLDPKMKSKAASTGKRSRQQTYSDAAVRTYLTIKVLFGVALRQTTAFVENLLKLVGLEWKVPDFRSLLRCQKALAVNIPYRGSRGALHLLVDSTGIKVEGEGKWHARKDSGSKRYLWRKIHFGINEHTLEIQAV